MVKNYAAVSHCAYKYKEPITCLLASAQLFLKSRYRELIQPKTEFQLWIPNLP